MKVFPLDLTIVKSPENKKTLCLKQKKETIFK